MAQPSGAGTAPSGALAGDPSNRISTTHTVIEINGRDFPGLLHWLTRTLADLGLQIQTATVSTYGERVVDVFM